MTTDLSQYLENIKGSLRLGLSEERTVINELETHIEDTLQELKEKGFSEGEAAKTCIGLLGSAKLVACQLYEAHSQGTWKQALVASMPHLLFGLSFALNWWQHIGWLSVLMTLVIGAVVYGWWHDKPTWFFPWLGYSLLPPLVVGLLLIYLPKAWSLLTLPLYLPLALWWLYYIVVQSIRRDWLFSSLMLLPIPIIIGWFLAVAPEGRFNEYSIQCVYDFAPSIGLSFLALAFTIITFIRLRQRWLRIASLIICGLLTLCMVVYSANGRLTLLDFLVLSVVMWGLFLIPPLLERRIKKWWGKTRSIPPA